MNHSYGASPENNSSSALSVDFGFGVVVLVIWALQLPRFEKAVGVSEAVGLRLVPRRCLSGLGAA